jgi:hypothetical protein
MSTYNKLLAGLLVSILGLCSCASGPEPETASVADTPNSEQREATALDKQFEEAARGMNKVERDGVLFYCKRSRQMGTNISTLKCQTEAQLRVEVETMAKYRDDMRNKMGKCTGGRAGHGGPCGAL